MEAETYIVRPPHLRGDAPFPIRGHHLGWFLKAGRTEVAGEDVRSGSAITATVNELVTNIESCDDPEYVKDVLGSTPSDKESVVDSYVNIFTCFNTLPDDFPVTINSKPDLMCQSCPIGRHCKRQPYYGDDRHTRRLYTFMRHYNVSEEEGIPLPRNPSEDEHHLSLATTVGTVRKIFEFMREKAWYF